MMINEQFIGLLERKQRVETNFYDHCEHSYIGNKVFEIDDSDCIVLSGSFKMRFD